MTHRCTDLVGGPLEASKGAKRTRAVGVGSVGKVSEDGFKVKRWRGPDLFTERERLVRGQAVALHPRVDIDVNPDSNACLKRCGGKLDGCVIRVNDSGDVVFGNLRGIANEDGSEAQDWSGNSGFTQLDGLPHREHAESLCSGVQRSLCNRHCAVTVRVRLDHGSDTGWIRLTSQHFDIRTQRRQVDFGPAGRRNRVLWSVRNLNHGAKVTVGVGGADSGVVLMLPVAADAARLFPYRLLGVIALACWAAALAVACSGDEEPVQQQEAAPSPQVDDQPAVAPPPLEEQQVAEPEPTTRSPGDPALLLIAESSALEHNGYWEQALSVRESAIATGASLDANALTSLQLDRVRLLLKLERPSDAMDALGEIAGFLTSEQTRRHALLRAQSALHLSQVDVALEAMKGYVNSDSAAWAMIALETARTLQRAGRGEEAIEWAERALGGMLAFQDRLRAIHLAATELDIAGEADRALERYDELLALSPWRDDQAAAWLRTGALKRDLGDLDGAQEAWRTLVDDYQDFAESWEALALLIDLGADIDQLTIGRIRFNEQLWVEARTAMLNVLGSSGDIGEQVAGEYYIAAIHQANDDRQSAALGYVAVIGRDASHPLAAESAMRLAEFALADGDHDAAEGYWRQVMENHPQHDRAVEAARRWASMAVGRGQWSPAAERFRDAANIGADDWGDDVRQEFLYWSALMYREAGDAETAADLASKVIDINPVGYYGLRTAALLELDAPVVLDISIDEWLMRLTREADAPESGLTGAPEWQAARDLRLGGFDDAADRMLMSWISTLAPDPWVLAQASQMLADEREFSASARAAAQLLNVFGLDWIDAPAELVRLAYPQPWPDVMALHSTAEGVDPLLLWSLIRRESFYDASAEGLAGEVGLTQVIPPTGSDIAAGLEIEYEHTDLARPELAIRFGAWYLARQLEGFSNEPIMALAAYNAGPGNAARWEDDAAFAGPDGFLATLDFASTRMYVRFVIESLAAYEAVARSGP